MATLKTNTLTGTSTAGSIAVTGEGNSTTTNLQQGLAKAWCSMNQVDAAINGSLNTSSITDHGTGNFQATWNNDFANVNYSCVGVGGSNSTSNPGPIYAHDTLPNVGYWKYFGKTMAAAVVDMHYVAVTAHGDLA